MKADIYQEAFKDFKSSATTDGSYLGINKAAKEQEAHMRMKVQEQLKEANLRLKEMKAKVSLTMKGNAIQLRATLPLKPNDTNIKGRQTKQYQISLNIPANLDGLKTAEEEAYELSRLISRKCFEWNDKYLGCKASQNIDINFGEIYDKFEDIFFKTRKRDIKSEHTFTEYKKVFKREFNSDLIVNKNNIEISLSKIDSSSKRFQAIKVASIICKYLEIDIDLKKLKLPVIPQKRDIPQDKVIIDGFYTFEKYYELNKHKKNPYCSTYLIYRLAYGLIANYGLRPREVFNQPDIDWFISEDNKDNTWKVHNDNKTGAREVLPFMPEWIELFDLKSKKALEMLKQRTDKIKSFSQLTIIVDKNSQWFKRIGLEFKPYDLRHACAIRAHLQGIPLKAAADNLGHSIEMHTKVYQRWFSLENRKKAMNTALNEKQEMEMLQEKNISLQKKVESLTLELEKYKLNKIII
ncbi:site-specific integrase [Plectonema cf. radiosum LEGE 06105]|uniref:Site-specific integrase n=1 Tax=Plectonema cf. radiosum LEGE 06105 TaxID=945769 RepID=A0A8J7JZ97_9CYAN|nr:site-specific integrase [Plectonema radiosum]MBE9212176.1 site-specific integrase [Plectonema cf. radiosum LEGE 06105]